MTCVSFLDHLRGKKSCVFHRAIQNYLEIVFCKNEGKYLGLNTGHWSFYGQSDEKMSKENESLFLKYLFKKEEKDRKPPSAPSKEKEDKLKKSLHDTAGSEGSVDNESTS